MRRFAQELRLAFLLKCIGFFLAICLASSLAFIPSVLGQSPLPNTVVNPVPESAIVSDSEFSTAEVSLDGRVLFYVGATSIVAEEGSSSSATPARLRAKLIAEKLSSPEFLRINPDDLTVEFRIDEDSMLPVIYVNNNYLMTVTTLDARIRGVNARTRAQELVPIIRQSLIQAYRERRPENLIQQGTQGAC